ncbi:hypothetical protein [Pedobacter ginsengisoli]|nr:hypothetical protein [Pedobacter ginsengisoli]
MEILIIEDEPRVASLGLDMLTDKNRTNWIYQGKPWVGILFGITLN